MNIRVKQRTLLTETHELNRTTQIIKEKLNKDGKPQMKESNRNPGNKKSL
jgi:hypothetical protein